MKHQDTTAMKLTFATTLLGATLGLASLMKAETVIVVSDGQGEALRAAIASSSPGDVIQLSQEVSPPNPIVLTGPIQIPWNLEIQGPLEHEFNIGSGHQPGPAFEVHAGVDLTLSNINFKPTNVPSDIAEEVPNAILGRGNNVVTLRHCEFVSNTTGRTIRIETDPSPGLTGSLLIDSCRFEGNNPIDDRALISSAVPIRVDRCLFLNNLTDSRAAGGSLFESLADGGPVELVRSTFVANGGEQFFLRFPAVFISQCELTLNSGTIRADEQYVAMAQTTVSRHQGIAVRVDEDAFFRATQCTFSNGRTAFDVSDEVGTFELVHCTIVNNVSISRLAAVDMDVDHRPKFRIRNCIISGNQRFDAESGTYVAADVAGEFDDLGGNFIGGDPMLAPLTDNGGLTRTHLPLGGSPVIDAGVTADFALFDQRGFGRVAGIAPDAGAVESAGRDAGDLDNDGLPDLWEDQFGIDTGEPTDAEADADGDGIANLDELNARTDPADPRSFFRLESESIDTDTVRLSWQPVPGVFYKIEGSSDLQTWHTVPTHQLNGVTHLSTIRAPFPFFRVRSALGAVLEEPNRF